MKRTDVHRPSAIDPSEYEFVAPECLKLEGGMADVELLKHYREVIRAHMARTGGTYSNHEHGGNCMVCGNVFATYTLLYYHAKSNTYVRVGETCADKMDLGEFDMNSFRRQVSDALEARAGKRKAQAMLEEKGQGVAWELYIADYDTLPGEMVKGYCALCEGACNHDVKVKRVYSEEITVRDIVSKLVKYGSISDKAADYLGTLLKRIADRPALLAQRATEKAAAADCPKGRVTVTGTVLKIEERENAFGVVDKMTIKAREGFIVWVTKPRHMSADKGQEVTITMTLTPSDRDPKFGFAKRPVFKPEGGDNAELQVQDDASAV